MEERIRNLEQPVGSTTSSSDEDDAAEVTTVEKPVLDQSEIEFYRSLIAKEESGSADASAKQDREELKTPNLPEMKHSSGVSDDEADDIDSRWTSIDQSGSYLKEYEVQLRNALMDELGFPSRK